MLINTHFKDRVEGLDFKDWADARDKDETPSHSASKPPPPLKLPKKFRPPTEVLLSSPEGCEVEDDPLATNNVPQKKRLKAKAKGKGKRTEVPTRNPISLLYKFTNFIPPDVHVSTFPLS